MNAIPKPPTVKLTEPSNMGGSWNVFENRTTESDDFWIALGEN